MFPGNVLFSIVPKQKPSHLINIIFWLLSSTL